MILILYLKSYLDTASTTQLPVVHCVSKCHGRLLILLWSMLATQKGHPPSADLRYEEKDSISPSTLIFAAIKSKLGIYTLHIHPDVPKNLALR